MLLQTGSPPDLAPVRGRGWGTLEGSGRRQRPPVGVTSLGGAEGKAEGVPARRKDNLLCWVSKPTRREPKKLLTG